MPTISFKPSTPLYQGSGAAAEVPGVFYFGINGRGYVLDTAAGGIKDITLPILKQQQDNSGDITEQSINPANLWREVFTSWHKGAGQPLRDEDDADPDRFDQSKGIDIWTKGEISLLPATDQKRSSANTNLRLEPAGARLYLIDGANILYTSDVTVDSPTWTSVTGAPATSPTSIVSDGFNVWTAHGADRVYKTDTSSAATAAYVTSGDGADLLGYVKGRLMAAGTGANKHKIYNITATGAMPAALFTHPNTDFTWVGFADAPGHILCAGYSGDKSLIYKTAIKADGTALDTPSVAGELPDGEIIRSIYGYLGFVFLGTDKGVRFATVDSNGNLTIGALNSVAKTCRAFEGQDKYVWFGIDNYDSTSTGLGRLTPKFLDTEGVPAHATDLMATTQGNVLSVKTFQDRRVFTVSGVGVFGEDTVKVASGTIDSGEFTYKIPEQKVLIEIETSTAPLDGEVEVLLSADQGSFVSMGDQDTANSTGKVIPGGQTKARSYEMRLTLTRSASDTTMAPVVRRVSARGNPVVPRNHYIDAWILLHDSVQVGGQTRPLDPHVERTFLDGLIDAGAPVTLQRGTQSVTVIPEDGEWTFHHVTSDGTDENGTYHLRVKRI